MDILDLTAEFTSFTWDENKSVANTRKHGVPFEIAQQAFCDKQRKIFQDQKHSRQEQRYYCYGMVNGEILTVRFTIRNMTIRIIGAGFWRKGRKIYYETQVV
jgi:uncharacterized protein